MDKDKSWLPTDEQINGVGADVNVMKGDDINKICLSCGRNMAKFTAKKIVERLDNKYNCGYAPNNCYLYKIPIAD